LDRLQAVTARTAAITQRTRRRLTGGKLSIHGIGVNAGIGDFVRRKCATVKSLPHGSAFLPHAEAQMRRTLLLSFALVSLPGAVWPQGAPIGAEFRVNTTVTGSQTRPSIGRDAAGTLVVVWANDLGGINDDIFGQRYDSSGAPQGPEFRVNTYITNVQAAPAVSVQPSTGSFVVVWQSGYQGNPNFGEIFGQRYATTGAPLGAEFRVNTYTTNLQSGPSIATDASGNFVVVWASESQDGSARGIFGQRYDSSGTPQGPEFRVNTFTVDIQYGASVAADPSGNFVVAWSRWCNYGYGRGNYAQR
jgi:hypothetical protein